MPTDPLLEHLEKTFAEAYRKEIDQEENAWRSMPFFAAIVALQLTALAQVRDSIFRTSGWLLWTSLGVLALAGASTVVAIVFLGFSIWPADFQYVAREIELLRYAGEVRRDAAEASNPGQEHDVAESACRTVKALLLEQYAASVANNRFINQRRIRWRTRAGLATLAAVLAALVLVGLVVVSNVHGHG